jgi:hypothetical protein
MDDNHSLRNLPSETTEDASRGGIVHLILEWVRASRKDRLREAQGGVKIHTQSSGRRWVDANEVMQFPSVEKHFRALEKSAGDRKANAAARAE